MLDQIIEKHSVYFSKHPLLCSLAHALGGFGIAVILQQYTIGNSFVPVIVGWLCFLASIAMHVAVYYF